MSIQPLNPKPFIGRQAELARLREQSQKGTASFVVIKGRRRIGKSRLVDEFGKQFDAYYKFEGLAPLEGVGLDEQLNEFSNQITRVFQAPRAKYLDFSDAFLAIAERVSTGRVLVFLDELSWMGSSDPAFLAKLKIIWDNFFSKNPQLVFIVCSSISSWINKNLLSSTAFVGRISLTLTLDELSLSECSSFWPEGIATYEKLKVLSITGGIPRYLEEFNFNKNAEDNIRPGQSH
jgi:AAA+ ATPase superfamily predicted ATPase